MLNSRTPSRYESASGPLARAWALLAENAIRLYYRALVEMAERGLFGRFSGILARPFMQCMLRARLRAIEPGFDAQFYLRQFDVPWRRAAVARGPLLHYALVGWRQGRPPNPRFDPAFYRRDNPGLVAAVEPVSQYLSVAAERGRPCNEVEKAASHPWLTGGQAVLTIHHDRGGGSSTFLDLYEQDLWHKSYNVLRLRAVAGAPTLAVVQEPDVTMGQCPTTRVFDLSVGRGELVEFADALRVGRVVVNHLIDRPPASLRWVQDLCAALACPYDVILHDYYALCPRVDMVTGGGVFCDTAPSTACVQCVAAHGSEVEELDVLSWRRDFLAFLAQADTIIVPSEDLANRMRAHVARPFVVWPPEDDLSLPPGRSPRLGENEVLRVATLGGLPVKKGSRVLLSLAREARASGAPFAFTVIGASPEARLLGEAGVKVTGAYVDNEIERVMDDAAPHVIFLPAIWPETWSFVLTAALRRGYPVIAFDIGAPAERLRSLGRGHLLPLELSRQPAELLVAFRRLREQWVVR